MFKRLFWLLVGAGLGSGGTLWVLVRVRRTAARFTPTGVTAEVSGAVRQMGLDLRDAAAEGRAGMREAEARLRSELGAPAARR
ncbi:MAG: hypothetical protein JJE52_10795 [Acidimicrobiia bacterium]|nr:hypothetical protein [Acidimicrobiia bacterium]